MKSKCEFYCYLNTREKNKIITKKHEKTKLVAFDMDGVIIDSISSWKYIHDYFNTSNDHSVDDYLKGKIDDLEFIKRDAMLWEENGKLITKNKLRQIVSDVPLMKGAKGCINFLKEKGVKTAIVSAGLDVVADIVKEKLDIDYVFCNGVKEDKDGRLTAQGILEVKLMYKDKNILELSKTLDIPLEKIISVGNSCFDIPMLEVSGIGIAFNPDDDCVRESADYIVEVRDMSKLIPLFEKHL